MRVAGIILARLHSSRMPRKVLTDWFGHPALWHVIERTKKASKLDVITLAIPHADKDIADVASRCGIGCFRYAGSENDVIGRLYACADSVMADIVVRVNADNWAVEPSEIDRAVEYYLKMQVAFVSNMHQHSDEACGDKYAMWWHGNEVGSGYPDGIGCEVFSRSRLQLLHETTTDLELREHPHLIFHHNGEVWSPSCPDSFARPDVKLDVNTPEDLALLNRLYAHIGGDPLQVHITQLIKAWDALHVAHDLV